MRRPWKSFGPKYDLKSGIQKGFGKSETSHSSPDFIVSTRTMRDGSRVKFITMSAFSRRKVISTGNVGAPDALRISRILTVDGAPISDEIEFFLESGWIHIYPGNDPGKLFYSPHLLEDYNNRETLPCYLDRIQVPSIQFIVRNYTAWMNDTVIYRRGSRRQDDATNNRYAHSSRLGLFTRCCLSSKLDTSRFLEVLESSNSHVLSYFIYVDEDLVYYLIKVTQTTVSRARILFQPIGDALRNVMLTELNGTPRIDQFSTEHENLRKSEAYLFAAAKNTTAFEDIGTISVSGSSIYYGWNANWNGTEAVIVTTEQENLVGATMDGLRNRLYKLTIDPSVSLTEEESELGTPGLDDITIYYPDTSQTPGRMSAWFPLAVTQSYAADLDSDMPFHAFYKEDDDTLCEVWFKHDADVNKPQVNYLIYSAALGSVCGGGGVDATETFSTHPSGATEYGNGFYLKNGPSALDLFMNYTSGSGVYELKWETELTGGGGIVCLDEGKSGFADLENHDCTGGFIAANRDSLCCGSAGRQAEIDCGDAFWTRDYYSSRTHLVGSVMMFNFNEPASATLVQRRYDGWSGHTNILRRWFNQVMEWFNSGAGSGKQGYRWDATFVGELFPDFFSNRVCTTQYQCDCITAGETLPAIGTGKAASGTEIHIKHYVVTSKEVVTVLDDTYSAWNETGDYEDIAEPTVAYPYFDHQVLCHAPIENYIVHGDFIDNELKTDMDIDEEHLGFLTIPVGRA